MTEAEVEFPGYAAGMWSIDPANSEAGFSVRHLGVARVHGRFNAVDGTINVGPTVEQSSVTARIETDSIDTGFPARDGYIRGEDVLATGEHKQIVFQSTAVRRGPDGLLIDGELTIRSVTRPVTLTAQVGGFGVDPVRHVQVLGVSARVTIDRADFAISPHVPAAVVGEKIEIHLDIQASLGS